MKNNYNKQYKAWMIKHEDPNWYEEPKRMKIVMKKIIWIDPYNIYSKFKLKRK